MNVKSTEGDGKNWQGIVAKAREVKKRKRKGNEKEKGE